MDGTSDLRARAIELLRNRRDLESALELLRKIGCMKLESIEIVRQELGVELGQAKDVVHLSRAWQDVRERDDALHDAVFNAVSQSRAGRSRKDESD